METSRNENRPPLSEALNDEELQFLEVNSIVILDKKVPRYPYAKFRCKACNYHLSDIQHVTKHVERHKKRENRLLVDLLFATAKCIPFSSTRDPSTHYSGLSQFLERIYLEQCEEEATFKVRKEIGDRIIEEITTGVADIALQLNGSSVSCFALKNISNMDFSLQIKEMQSVKDTLNAIYDLLASKKNKFYRDLRKDFKQKYPKITFTTENDIPCQIILKNTNSLKTSLLLRDYWDLDPRVRILGIVARYWAYSCGFTNNEYTVIPSHSIILLLIHYLIHEDVVPCIKEYLPPDDEKDYETPQEKLSSWKTKNSKSTGELWIGFLKYYCVDFDTQDVVVQISSGSCITKVDLQWKYKRLSIQDPYCCNKNLLSVVHNTTVFEYIQKCFQYSCLFFGIIQTQNGPLFKIVSEKSTQEIVQKIEQHGLNDELSLSEIVTLETAKVMTDAMEMEDMVFEWNVERFNNNSKIPIVCSVCTNEGHTQDSCPDEILPVVKTMAPLPKNYLMEIDKFFHINMLSLKFSMQELIEREKILKDMVGFIRRSGYPTAVLSVYGSSDNGFGFKDSDLDLCLTFRDHETSENIDSKIVIEKVAKIIQRMKVIWQVRAVTSAKVPIIKFVHRLTGLEGDISFYNCLAFENTKLLRAYSEIDLRVKILGYNVKRFIKSCDFGDASRGSLSSYTCVILALFYLQQLDPPVIPVLQELPDSNSETPSRMFEGHNVWFNSNSDAILDWKNSHPKNNMSPAELLIGFFDFFGRKFDDDNIVVSIRTHNTLKKIDKMWNTDCLAVEDPFEVNRNLGGRLTRRMHLFIKKCFIKGYERFATPMPERFPFNDPNRYFFNASNLGVGKVPTDRGCHICGGIWHVVRECPRKMMTKRHKANKKNHDEKSKSNNSNNNKKSINEHKGYVDESRVQNHRSNEEDWRQGLRNKGAKALRAQHTPNHRKEKLIDAPKIISPLRRGGGEPSSPLPYQQPSKNINEDNSYTVDLMDILQKSMNLNKNHEQESGFHKFVHGAIRAEDLEKIFEPNSPVPPSQIGGHPPPGFVAQKDRQPLVMDKIFHGLPPPHSGDARTISSSIHNNSNNNHMTATAGGTPDISPVPSQQFSVPIRLPFDVEHNTDIAKNNGIEHLLGPGLILPPTLTVPGITPGGPRFVNGAAPLLDVQRHLMHTGPLGSPPGYLVPLGIPSPFPIENHKGFFDENRTTSSNPQLIHNHPTCNFKDFLYPN